MMTARSTNAHRLSYACRTFLISVLFVACLAVNVMAQAPGAVVVAVPSTVTGTTTKLYTGAPPPYLPNSNYNWTSTGPASVGFSSNGTLASQNITATFSHAGTYIITLTYDSGTVPEVTGFVTVIVNQTATAITVTPASGYIAEGQTDQCTATLVDPFGNPMSSQPTFSWSSSAGSVSNSGLYTSGQSPATATVTASADGLSGQTYIGIESPIISGTSVPSAYPNPTDRTTVLTSAAIVQWDPHPISYTWSGPPGVTFSTNGSMISSTTTATFPSAGSFVINVVVSDGNGVSTSGSVTVVVDQEPTSITVTPASNSITTTQTDQCSYQLLDQFSNAMSSTAGIYWVAGMFAPAASEGSITTSGLFSPGPDAGIYQVKCGNGGLINSANITVAQPAPANLAATAGNNDIALAWTSTATATSGVTYNVYRASQAYIPPSSPIATGITSPSYTDSSTIPGILYHYQVTAVENSIESAASNEASTTAYTAPTIAEAASASPDPVTGTTTNLSVLGADLNGEPGLTYAWAETGPAPVTYSINGTNASKNTTATFASAGSYIFTATVTNIEGLTARSSVTVTVNQTQTGVAVSPSPFTLAAGGTQQFTASQGDQFGNPISGGNFTGSWSAVRGTIDQNGNYTAPLTTGPDTVTVINSVSNIQGTAAVTVATPPGPSNLSITVSPASPIAATTAGLVGSATGTGPLTYTWTSGQSASFSPPSGSATTVTFPDANTYVITLTVTDGYGQQATTSTTITVNSVPTTVRIAPSNVAIQVGALQTFYATLLDQFARPSASQPTWTWSADRGSVDSNGNYTAPFSTGADKVYASDNRDSLEGSTGISVGGPPAPSGLTITVNTPTPITGTTASLTGSATGSGTLTYSWSSSPSASFSATTGANTTVTFPAAGIYAITLTATDSYNDQSTTTLDIDVLQSEGAVVVQPQNAVVAAGDTQSFFAWKVDQFGNEMASQPTWTWAAANGQIASTGVYTAPPSVPTTLPNDTVTATDPTSGNNGSATVTVITGDQRPTVAAAAAANPNPVNGTSTQLSVLGAYYNGESELTYTWSTFGPQPGPVTFSINATNAAKATTANFFTAGTYTLSVQITDPLGVAATSQVTVVVHQYSSALSISPTGANLTAGASQQFTAAVTDQFGHTDAVQPQVTWSVASGIGDVSDYGLYQAPDSAGSATVQASVGLLTANANVTISSSPINILYAVAASPNPVSGVSTVLSVVATESAGEGNLSYTWSCNGPAPVTYTTNGGNASKTTTAFFSQAGTYNFTVTIADSGGQTTTSSVSVIVNQTPISLIVSPANQTVNQGQAVSFTASGTDQFGNTIAGPIQCTWAASSYGSFVGNVFTGTWSGISRVTATDGLATGSTLVTISNGLQGGTLTIIPQGTRPTNTLASSPYLAAFVVPGATDDSWNYPLSYSWSGSGPGTVTFGTDSPYSVLGADWIYPNYDDYYVSTGPLVYVSAPGTYTINCTVSDAAGNSVASQSASFTVQTFGNSVSVSPPSAVAYANSQSYTFTATAFDEFGNEIEPTTDFQWWTGYYGYYGSQEFNGTGAYDSQAIVSLASGYAYLWGGISASYQSAFADVPIYDGTLTWTSPTKPGTPIANPNPVTGTMTSLTLTSNNTNLTEITWSCTDPSVEVSGDYLNSTLADAYFSKAGNYEISATVTAGPAGSVTTDPVTVQVVQTLTRIVVSPPNPSIIAGNSQKFQAVAYDQFGNLMDPQPVFTWSFPASQKPNGAIDPSTGIYIPLAQGSVTIQASADGVSGQTVMQVYALPPTIQTPATANPQVTYNGTTSLSVLGQDNTGESNLIYTWTELSGPGPVSFSYGGGQNSINASKNSSVAMSVFGVYQFQAAITNKSNLSVISTVSVNYLPSTSGRYIVISPENATIGVGDGIQYSAEEVDASGNPINTGAAFTWSRLSGVGSISKEGIYNAGPASGMAVIKVSADGLYTTTGVTVGAQSTVPAEAPPPGYAEDAIPTDSGSDSDGAGPASSIAVSLPSLAIQNNPGPDISSYNPYGPSVSFERFYRGYLVPFGASIDGLSPGWTDSYSQTIESSNSAPWSPLTINYPNGGTEILCPTVTANGITLSHPAGAPYFAVGSASGATGVWSSLTLTYPNHSAETYTPSSSDPSLYLLTAITDIAGQSVSINRDTSANNYRILTITNSASQTLLKFNYAGNNLSSVQDLAPSDPSQDRQVNYTFNAGNLTEVSLISPYNGASSGVSWLYDYTVQSVNDTPLYYLSQVSCPNPVSPGGTCTATTNFDGVGHVSSVADSMGHLRSYVGGGSATGVTVWNAGGSKAISWSQNFQANQAGTGAVDDSSNTTQVSYGSSAHPFDPTSGTNRNGQTDTVTYADPYGHVWTSTDPRGVVTTNTYTNSTAFPIGELTNTTITNAGATLGSAQYSYFGNGLLQSETGPAPGGSGTVTSSYTYSALGDVLSVTAPGNNQASTLTTTYAYGQPEHVGEPLSVSDPAGDTSHFSYDARGNVTQATDASGNASQFYYNLANQRTGVVYPDGAYTLTFYEYLGGPLQKVVSYDSSGNAAREVDYTYTSEGEVASVTGSTQPAYYTYDGASRVSTMTDGNGNTTHYRYDRVGNLLDERYPRAGGKGFDTDTYQYDKDGNVISEIDGRGLIKNYQRNDVESLVTGVYYWSYGLNGTISVTPPVTFAYDAFGRRTSMADGTGTTTDTLDSLGNIMLRSRTLAFGPTTTSGLAIQPNPSISYSYYPDNSLQGIATVDPLNVYGASSFQYDGAGRMTQAVTPSGEIWQHAYQPNGWLLSSTSPTLSVAYTYNSRGFLTGLTNTNLLTSTPLSTYSGFSYDAVGNRLGFSAAIPALGYYDTNGNPITTQPLENYTSSFSYDTARPFANMNRDVLTQEMRGSTSVGQYNYDAAYNDVPVNEDNQITSNGSLFDGQGNPTTYVNEPLTFDAENRLTSINGTEQFTYDGEGHRFCKTNYSPYSSNTTYYTYSGNTLLSEDNGLMALFYGYTADGLRSAAYAPTPNYTALEGGPPSQTSQFDFLYDPQGNLVQRTDNTELGVDQFTAYNAYGYPLAVQPVGSQYGSTKGLTPTSVGYEGQYGYYNDGNGLLLLGARYYDPGARRFLNRDPIDYKGGSNLYAYCDGNPVNEADPNGTDGIADYLGVILKNACGSPHESMDQTHQNDMAGAYAALDGGSYDTAYANSYNASISRQLKSRRDMGNAFMVGSMVFGLGEGIAAGRAILILRAEIAAGDRLLAETLAKQSSAQIQASLAGKNLALKEMWGTGSKDAEQALARIQNTKGFTLPQGVTRETLLAYRELIFRNVASRTALKGTLAPNDVGLVRLKIIELALKRTILH